MSKYITIDGRDYYSPCDNCKDRYCFSCVIHKYQEDLNSERDKRSSAEFRIENELEPRIKAEKNSYDCYVATDRSVEWCDCFDFRVNELVDMFDENFDFSVFDFDGDDITSKVARLIYESVKKGGDT
jgi:hypothetical protein